ncbi:hypothetical protein [Methanoculleus chikugoensis]|uniref:Uncharacterized protein n=1 Tax=Methanoculleus chikugoensis TaxID=118126 RepID=A0ABN5XDN9_9EURY|nr:hypothetical protein [Methanoculleus chikugoensis]BBL67098.1 hypothetical protein MchiMG62_02790 [Methanoculleus chikugoensis]
MRRSLIGGAALLVCVFVAAAVVLGAGAQNPAGVPVLAVGDSTHVIVAGATSVSDLAAAGIPAPDELKIPKGAGRYDIVTFNHAALSREMEGGTLLLRVRGTEYLAEVHRMNFEQIDDDIDSYEGRIVGVGESDVLLTTSENGLIGSVTLGRETFRIEGVEPRARAERSASPLHIIYSSRGAGWF